jgi:hypothetical protein
VGEGERGPWSRGEREREREKGRGKEGRKTVEKTVEKTHLLKKRESLLVGASRISLISSQMVCFRAAMKAVLGQEPKGSHTPRPKTRRGQKAS